MNEVARTEIEQELARRQQMTASPAEVQGELARRQAPENPNYAFTRSGPMRPDPAPTRGLLDRGRISDLMLSARNLVIGDTTREFDIPEIPVNVDINGETVPIQDKLAVARGNPLAQAGILKNYFPKAAQDFDAYGNLVLTFPEGQRFYANRPGASWGDASEGIITAASELGLARIGGGIGNKVAGAVGSAAGAGAGLAAASVGQDVMAQRHGSTQPVDLDRAAMLGALGVGGEFLGYVGGRLLDRVLTNARYVQSGRLTSEGEAVLRRAEIDPASVSPEFIQNWGRAARSAVDPAAAARQVDAQTLPSPVPLSRGDVTRDVRQQAFEDAAVKGARGEPAQQTMQAFRQRQQESLRSNLGAVQERVGGAGVRTVGEGMEDAQSVLAAQRDSLKASVNAAYKAATDSGASVAAEGVKQASNYMRASLKTWNPRTAPKAHGLLQDFEQSVTSGTGYRVQGVKVDALENWLQQVNKLARSSVPVEAGAAKTLARKYNEFFDEQLDQALIRGEPKAIEAYRHARTLRKQFADTFERDNLLSKIIEKGDPGSGAALKLTPTEALNVVFTANTLGGKMGSVRTLERIKTLLGPDSVEWKALKEEGFLRLISSQGRGGSRGVDMERLISGDKLATSIDKSLRTSKELWETLYTSQDRALIQQLKRVALQATNRVPGAVNTSASALELTRIANDMFGPASKVVQFLSKQFGIGDAANAVRARTATLEGVPRRLALPPGTAGGATGAAVGAAENF